MRSSTLLSIQPETTRNTHMKTRYPLQTPMVTLIRIPPEEIEDQITVERQDP